MEADLTITGKSGDTSVVAQLGLDQNPGNEVEQLYMKSKVAGIDVKLGIWKNQKSELGIANGNWDNRIKASTSFGGVKLTYEDWSGAGGTKIAIAGTIGGVKVMHKVKETSNETKASGSMGGIDVAYHFKDYDNGNIDDSYTLKTSVQGIEVTYVNTSSDAGTVMDGFIGKNTTGDILAANALGVSIMIAGNKITYKDIDIEKSGVLELSNMKLIVTRKLLSGTTFEATYDDNAESLDLELAVKF